jgi:hypothetical protein
VNAGDPRSQTEMMALPWALLGATVCSLMIPLEPNLLEEGLIIHVAQRMVGGERLYRDVASFTGPFPFELLAALFRIFGEEVAVGRGALVVFHGLACASVYGVALRAGAGPLAHAAAACVASAPVLLFPLFSLFFHTTLAFELCLIAAYPAVRGVHSARWALVAGIAVACAALCKQTVGALLAVGVLAGVVAVAPPGRRIRQALAIALGGALVAGLTVAVYGARGDLLPLWRSLVVLPLSFDESFSAPYMNFWPPGEFGEVIRPNRRLYVPSLYALTSGIFDDVPRPIILLTQLLYGLPIVALAATGVRRLAGPLSPATWIHTAVLLALIANLFPRTDWGHLVFVLPPALVQLFLLAREPRRAAGGFRVARWSAAALVLALGTGTAIAGVMIYDLSEPSRLGPHVPQRPVTSQVRSKGLSSAIRYLLRRTRPGEPIFVARAEPLIYFATGTRNPTPYSGIIPGIRAEQESAILAALEHVRYVVMSDIDQPLFLYYRDELPVVQAHLERYFRVPGDFPVSKYSWLTVLEPGPDRGPTAIDLLEIQADARAWVRDRDGVEGPPPQPAPKLATRFNRRPLLVFLGPMGGGIDFEIEIPPDAVFEADVGIAALVGKDDLYEQAEQSRLEISVAREESFETLASVHLVSTGRRWRPLRLDLSAYGGERVILRLELVPDAPLEPDLVAFWGSPRIALRAQKQLSK